MFGNPCKDLPPGVVEFPTSPGTVLLAVRTNTL